MRNLFIILIFVFPHLVKSQSVTSPVSEEIIEAQQEAADNSGNQEVPDPEQEWTLDLNAADITEIISSPLITNVQATAIIRHREVFGRFLTVEELQVTDQFDTEQLRKIRPFVKCGQAIVDEKFKLNELLAAARHEVLFRARRVLQDKEGFSNDGIFPFYRGDPNHFNFRYRMQAGRYFSAGIVMEKDAGENLLSRNNGGRMDYFSWHVYVKPERLVETIVVGDYQVQFGQGLVAWKGLSLGKSSEVQQFFRRGAGIRPYSSSGESGFNRGLAFTLLKQNWKFDGWTSYQKRDASLFPADSVFSNFYVSTIQESGLHRTSDEMSDKAVLDQFIAGGHLQWQNDRFRNEFTFQFQHFSFPLWPGDDPYERYDPVGRKFFNTGWSGRYVLPNATVYSEVATDAQGDPALIAGLLFMPDQRWTISLHYRNYDRAYQCIGCDALREGSKVQNENGFLTGILWQISTRVKMQGYLDYFSFPWLRFTSSSPINGKEWLGQFTYAPNRSTEIYVRYKQEEKPSDESVLFKKVPLPVIKNNVRVNVQWMNGKNWEFQARCEWVGIRQLESRQEGVMFYQEIRYKPMGKAYSFSLRWSVFSTESYDSRIYTYEQDMAGAFSLPAYSGTGYRYYLITRYRLMKGLDIWLRYSTSVFPNPTASGEEIEGKDEIKAQIRWQF
ncbi:MAG: helix-hairpin-helix domain-containing protein [Bacteroidetes bacterium]|jgi:hypothetical protein|nr:helix-hairpin-helix domain-containing protein [Bacteroidota bacterium]